MATPQIPEFRELDEDDIRAILGRNNVGRLGFDWSGQVEIRPMNYVYRDGRVYGRTGAGAKFTHGVAPHAPVVFEVDEVEAVLRWKSVIVRGTFDILTPDGPDAEERALAAKLLRRVVKHTFMADDPLPERDIVFRILVEEATGRASH